jgi:hypothetical protein
MAQRGSSDRRVNGAVSRHASRCSALTCQYIQSVNSQRPDVMPTIRLNHTGLSNLPRLASIFRAAGGRCRCRVLVGG